MATSTVENYLKQILLEQQQAEGSPVPMGKVASALGVVPGTTTTMAKSLADSGLVDYAPRIGVRLTEKGEKLALHVLRRHRLIELFLVEILGLGWSEIHDEAEKLEHVISDKVLEKIDAMLGYPTVDPHGDPIPTAKGKIDARSLENLSGSPRGEPLCISRITDQAPEFLQFIEDNGLQPGTELKILEQNRVAGTVTFSLSNGKTLTIGAGAAKKILVE